jgi:hypothetical protein
VTPVAPVTTVAPVAAYAHDADPTDDRRRILWRDSATILIGVILALLAYQTFVPGGVGGPTGSETPFPSGVSVGTLPPPVSLPPGVTFGPIVDPSLGVDATPTPIPVITLGPSPSPSPSPSPTASPTRKPTPKPSVKPATAPPPPSASPTPTAPPPPSVTVSCNVPTLSMTVTCTSTPGNIQAGSQAWTTNGAGAVDSGGDGTNTFVYTYTDVAGTYFVRVTVTGLDGTTTTFDEVNVTVPGV